MKHIIGLCVLCFLTIACTDPENETVIGYQLEYPAYFPQKNDIPVDNLMQEDKVELGRMLFYEKMLSADSSLSCGSCHQQQFAFSDSAQFSKGIEGRKGDRNSMAIVNSLFEKSFFWDGRANSLEEQALDPIKNPLEMDLSIEEAITRLKGSEKYQELFTKSFGESGITRDNLAKAIAQFERTLISGTSPYDLYKQGKGSLTEQERRGEQLFFTHPEPSVGLRGGNCGDCHSGPLTTNRLFSNNGLDIESIDFGLERVTGSAKDRGKFKIPTLRNIALSAPYMHDGRFGTLKEVLDHYNEHIQQTPNLDLLIIDATNEVNGTSLELTEQEKEDIIAFLHTLTDKEFIENPAFADPNKN
ncbi:MAG: cytochrome-c peroxidase [Cytophagales bacterium]|nr:cytochrome-c peroxidase [Cytophagales bacterium]